MRLFAVTMLSMIAATPGWAQTTPAPGLPAAPVAAVPTASATPTLAPDTPEVRAAIDEILAQTNFDRSLTNGRRDYVSQSTARLRTQLADNGFVLSERVYGQVGGVLEKQFDARTSAIRTAVAGVYRQSFTAEELTAIAAFYRSDIGKLMLTRMPSVNTIVTQTIQQQFNSVQEAAQPQIQAILDDALRGRQGVRPRP